MTPERWEQAGQLYHDALELESGERAAFLDRACAGDESLRREIESLLKAEREAGDFIAAPAFEEVAELIVTEEVSTLSGRRLGDYEVLGFLGKGGMGEVYLARDPSLNRKIALKLLLADFTRDETRVRRFVLEAKAVSALNHPNIITIHEIGEAEGRRYIATEFIEGQTLRRQMNSARLKTAEALDVAIQIACALNAAHAAGIVHRDIKPENVMVRPDGLVKVLDFGLAKLTERPAPSSEFDTQATTALQFKTDPGVILGTVAYMSPEQVRGEEVDARSDIFSLGVLCYEMIAGRRPFAGETSSHVIVAILDQEPVPLSQLAPGTPEALQQIIHKALRKDREARYQSAADLLSELKALKAPPTFQTLEFETQPTGATEVISTKGNLVRQLHRMNFRLRAAVITLVALIVVAGAGIYFSANRAPALTEKDTILLADFKNLTGDEVFDSTLKQALAVQLEQTPFLNFFPEDQIRETLRYMGRATDEKLTKELAREICQRQNVKALLVGSIARFDRRYSIALEAVNGQTGETIARALAEAEEKDQVLRTLGKAATQLRERLGESLASIQKFDAPLEQATTSSLEAFKAWVRGVEIVRSRREGAFPFYQRALELDPNFARVHVSYSLAYGNQGQVEQAAEYAAKAYALRERVTEREKFDIAANYHTMATGDLLKAIEQLELWRQTYPRDYSPLSRLASLYRLVGQLEKSLAAAQEAHGVNPRAYVPYVGMGSALVQLNRFDEAQTVIEQAMEQQLATPTSRRDLSYIALIKGDAAAIRQQIDWAAQSSDPYWAFHWQAQMASFAGKLRQAQKYYGQAIALASPRYQERADWFAQEIWLRNAACGLCREIKAGKAPAPLRITQQAFLPPTLSRALTLALCGDINQAQALADEIARANPQSTLANEIWLPVIRAAIEIERGNPDKAIQFLQPAGAYEPATQFWLSHLRGQAHLLRRSGAAAAAEFQKILDHRGWDAASPLWPLAKLGLARAAMLSGETAKSRQAYQDFLALWKEADADLPILIEAKKEMEASKSSGIKN